MELAIPSTLAPPIADDAEAAPRPPLRLLRIAVWGLAGTTSTVLGALVGGRSFETHLPGAWFFGMPGGLFGSIGSDSAHSPILGLILVFGGLIILCRVWFGFLRHLAGQPGFPVKKVVLVVAIWAVPLLLAPPLFSRDVYTYAGQGEMVSHHIDPYTYGPGVLGSTPFSTLPDSVWSNDPSPYGPTFLSIDGLLAEASGHRILPDIVLLRLLEVAGLALIVAATPTLARSLKRDPAEAVLLGAGSPLALMTLVAGAHNEALMLGLLLAGLAVAKRFGTVPGIVLCALAAGVKSPAALGVIFLGWVWAGQGASTWRRILHTAGAGLIALATMEVVAAVSGTGWGWLHAATNADKSFTGVTPVSVAARGISVVTHVIQLPVSTVQAHAVLSIIGLICAAGFGLWLLVRSPVDGAIRCLGLSLLAVALLGPILWAWYVTWGVVVLAPAALGRLRRALIVIITVEVFVGATSVHGVFAKLFQTFVLSDLVLIAALLAAWIVPLSLTARTRVPIPAVRPPSGGIALALDPTN
ncbi:MAG TPA: polyprenol phosphomannose-dependent alpha 1,6 mannosyltransferase MptB [Acidimicrobiales bacterium]|nr:polyprenol phosphomannose-dependent alpha 1,6 mannosyltransferase MptB [Acidimicrobiales bacterium]